MKINIENLRGVSSANVEFDSNCFISSNNGSGKTTIALAPYFALTGKGLEVKNKETSGSVTVDFGCFTLCRKISTSGKSKTTQLFLDGNPITEKNLNAELSRRNLHPSVLAQLFSPGTKLTNEDMLLAAGLKLDVTTTLNLVNPSENVRNEMVSYFSSEGVDIVTIPAVTKCEKFYMDQRKQIKKDIKALEANISEYGSNINVNGAELISENKMLSEKLNDLISKKAALQAELNQYHAANERKKSFERQIINMNERLNQLEEELTAEDHMKKEIDDLAKELISISDSSAIEEKKLSEVENALEKARSDYSSYKEKIAELKTSANEKAKTINVLSSTDVCPLYSGLNCSVNKENVIKSLVAERDTIIKDANELISKAKALSDEGTKLRTERDKISANMQSIRTKKESILISLENRKSKASHFPEMKDEKQRIETQLAEIIKMQKFDNSFSEADLVNSISTSDAEISKINTSISHNEIKIQSIAKAESYKKILDDKILLRDTYDKIISICRELPSIIFTKVIAPLETVAKETLSVLHPDWNLIFEVSGNVIVEKDVNNASIAIDSASLSRGESLLVNYILKVVYAKLIGVNYIIIDDADSLDEHHIKSLLECISKSSIPTLLLSANKITTSYELKEIKI